MLAQKRKKKGSMRRLLMALPVYKKLILIAWAAGLLCIAALALVVIFIWLKGRTLMERSLLGNHVYQAATLCLAMLGYLHSKAEKKKATGAGVAMCVVGIMACISISAGQYITEQALLGLEDMPVTTYPAQPEQPGPEPVCYRLEQVYFPDKSHTKEGIALNIIHTLRQVAPKEPISQERLFNGEYNSYTKAAEDIYEEAFEAYKKGEVTEEEWISQLELCAYYRILAHERLAVSENLRNISIRYMEIGDAYYGMGKMEEAYRAYEKAVYYKAEALYERMARGRLHAKEPNVLLLEMMVLYRRMIKLSGFSEEVDEEWLQVIVEAYGEALGPAKELR